MPLTETKCLILSCDGCSLDFETGYIPHYPHPWAAAEEAQESEWVVWQKDGESPHRAWCPKCLPDCAHCHHRIDYHGQQGADGCEYDDPDLCTCIGFEEPEPEA